MPENESDANKVIKALLLENQELLRDNNHLLHKIRRDAMWALGFRVVWFTVIIGGPLALYYFVLEPNVATLQDSFSLLLQGAKDVSGMREIFGTPPVR